MRGVPSSNELLKGRNDERQQEKRLVMANGLKERCADSVKLKIHYIEFRNILNSGGQSFAWPQVYKIKPLQTFVKE